MNDRKQPGRNRLAVAAACAAGVFFLTGIALTEAEARPEMAAKTTVEDRYKAMDANSDGKVTPEEFFAAYPQMKEGAFKAIDADADGHITLEEWRTFAAGHTSADPHGGMGAAAPHKSANGTEKKGMPSLIMPREAGK